VGNLGGQAEGVCRCVEERGSRVRDEQMSL
jgi:hypothetical protein